MRSFKVKRRSICVSNAREYRAMRLRPFSLARYMAASAWLTSVPASLPSSGYAATPMLADRCSSRSSPVKGLASASSTCWASALTVSVSSIATQNWSPPRRASNARWPASARMRCAARFSTWLPMWWPIASLTVLKWSSPM